jgi:hypothetical protein
MIPDLALLRIFDLYMDETQLAVWHTLVHVCRKWRNLVFGSPHRLNLRLHCEARTPVKEMLDVWPRLPIVIRTSSFKTLGVDNIVAALEHHDRICEVDLWRVLNSQLEKISAAMQQPFPMLTRLRIWFKDETAPVVPASFLGGSAPGLQTLWLKSVPFPGLPKLLSSATHLVHLNLQKIPHSGYISPEAMVTCLSVLTRLKSLVIGFESPRSRPDRKSQCPPRTFLPVLTTFQFRGVSEYLEDLVARIDAPLLSDLTITFFHQLTFDTPQLTQFISHTPMFKTRNEAYVAFSNRDVQVSVKLLDPPFQVDLGAFKLGISCRQSDWQLSSLVQVSSLSIPQALIPAVECLYIQGGGSRLHWQDDIESSQWLELFHTFPAVNILFISLEFLPRVAPAFQGLVGEE